MPYRRCFEPAPGRWVPSWLLYVSPNNQGLHAISRVQVPIVNVLAQNIGIHAHSRALNSVNILICHTYLTKLPVQLQGEAAGMFCQLINHCLLVTVFLTITSVLMESSFNCADATSDGA